MAGDTGCVSQRQPLMAVFAWSSWKCYLLNTEGQTPSVNLITKHHHINHCTEGLLQWELLFHHRYLTKLWTTAQHHCNTTMAMIGWTWHLKAIHPIRVLDAEVADQWHTHISEGTRVKAKFHGEWQHDRCINSILCCILELISFDFCLCFFFFLFLLIFLLCFPCFFFLLMQSLGVCSN